MSGAVKFSFSLPEHLFLFYETRAETEGGTGRDLMRRVLDQWAGANGGKDNPGSFDLVEYRALTQEVAIAAETICQAVGWQEDITLRAIRACAADPAWLARYCRLIGSVDPYVENNSVKRSINQNFGQYVKARLKARNKMISPNAVAKLQVTGEIVRSVTLLLPPA